MTPAEEADLMAGFSEWWATQGATSPTLYNLEPVFAAVRARLTAAVTAPSTTLARPMRGEDQARETRYMEYLDRHEGGGL